MRLHRDLAKARCCLHHHVRNSAEARRKETAGQSLAAMAPDFQGRLWT